MNTNKKMWFKRLFKYLKPYIARFLIAVVFMSAFAGLAASLLVVLKKAIDGIFVNKDFAMLGIAAVSVPVIFALKGLADYGRNYLLNYIGQNVIRDLRMELYEKLISLSHNFYVQNSSAKIMSRVTNDLNALQTAIVKVPASLVKDFLTFCGMLIAAFYLNWKFSLIVFIGFPIAAIPLVMFARKIRKASKQGQKQMAEIYSSLMQMLLGFSVIKAYNTEKHEELKFKEENDKFYDFALRVIRVDSRSSPIMNFLGAVAVAVVLFFGGADVLNGAWTAGAFFAFIAAVGQMYEPVRNFAKVNSQIQSGLASAERIFEVLDEEPAIKDAADAKILKPFEKSVVYKNVSFGYTGDKNILDVFNLTVNRGQSVAFVGHSGSGKTTVAALLLRFYDTLSGSILIDGQDIKEVTLKSLRQQVGIVSQDVVLFDDSIKYNIAYGSFDASEQDIIEAAKNANAHDFISALPDGYDTLVGERGIKLSGGEKQRISIARAILKNPPILILDEATSALDSESEKLVQDAVDKLMKNRTVILIAHRLATVRNADNIIVMDNGRIAETGRHEDLIRMENGIYKNLNELQVL
ncbi:MAG: ABC transporter ATP-binding protein/permease [Endomicrobium sp.]|jgi:subfamily B ATP-binding cassette protein MsbA|nr:ABC transporter ATP-binding protein/permease [Endomicrobium sp.]